jgi:hypothetical protein
MIQELLLVGKTATAGLVGRPYDLGAAEMPVEGKRKPEAKFLVNIATHHGIEVTW